MGTVYDCLDRNIERRVAIKVVRRPPAGDPEGDEAHGRFRREAQAAGRLSHPNIVGVFDFGENAETAWIIMELVEGGSLKDRLDRNERFPIPEIVRLMDQVLAALAYSHANGVVHRDIKPGNIMLARDGTVKMADFGIARLENSSMTQVGTVMGTPSYMAPEQLRGETVDARADIWAAGVMLYQLLTGEKPFEGGFSAVMHKALHTEPPPPSQLSVTAPRAFDVVVAKALAKRPGDRYASANAFAEAIRAAAAAGDTKAPATTRPPAPGTSRKAPVGLIAGGLGALAVVGIGAFLLLGPGGDGQPSDQQRLEQLRQAAEWEATERQRAAEAEQVQTQAQAQAQAQAQPQTQTQATDQARAAIEERQREDAARAAEAEEAARRTPAPDAGRQQAEARAREEAARAEADRARRQGDQARADAEQARLLAEQRARDDEARLAEQLRTDLLAAAATAAAFPCSLLTATTTPTTLSLAGVIRRGDEAGLRQAMAARGVPAEALRLQLRSFDGPYCQALDLVRPMAASPAAAPQVRILGNSPLAKGELLRMDVVTPGWPNQLYVSYLMQSGEMAHLVPSRPEAASVQVRLGEPGAGFTGWEVDEPFGTDLVLVFTSERPLFAQRRPVTEKTEDFLRALGSALRAAQGSRVMVRALVVETVARR